MMAGKTIETVAEAKRFLEDLNIRVRNIVAAMMRGQAYKQGEDANINVGAGRALLNGIISERKLKIDPATRAKIDELLPGMCEGYSGGTDEIPVAKQSPTSARDGKIGDTGGDLLTKYYSKLVDKIIQANRKDVLRAFFNSTKGCTELRAKSKVRKEIRGDLQGRVIDVFRNDDNFVNSFPALVDEFLDYLFNNREEIEPRVND